MNINVTFIQIACMHISGSLVLLMMIHVFSSGLKLLCTRHVGKRYLDTNSKSSQRRT